MIVREVDPKKIHSDEGYKIYTFLTNCKVQESLRQLLFTPKVDSKVMAPATEKKKKKKKVDSKVIKKGKLIHRPSTNVNSSSSLINYKTSHTPLSPFIRIH
jgi:hypothetical protein